MPDKRDFMIKRRTFSRQDGPYGTVYDTFTVFDYDGDYIQTFNTREEAENCLNSLIGANYQLYGRSEETENEL
jgi:hypothetical protein